MDPPGPSSYAPVSIPPVPWDGGGRRQVDRVRLRDRVAVLLDDAGDGAAGEFHDRGGR
jgi:hypothetical protein